MTVLPQSVHGLQEVTVPLVVLEIRYAEHDWIGRLDNGRRNRGECLLGQAVVDNLNLVVANPLTSLGVLCHGDGVAMIKLAKRVVSRSAARAAGRPSLKFPRLRRPATNTGIRVILATSVLSQ
jgi:hypothetical protein